jgi:hypothetical protein
MRAVVLATLLCSGCLIDFELPDEAEARCFDGVDNDGDGLIDGEEVACGGEGISDGGALDAGDELDGSAVTCTSPRELTIDPAGIHGTFHVTASDTAPERYLWRHITGDAVEHVDEFLSLTIAAPLAQNTALDLMPACTSSANYCWVLFGNFFTTGGGDAGPSVVDGDVYFANAGTITLSTTGSGADERLQVRTNGARFDHYVMGANGFVLAPDGCSTFVADTELDLPVQQVVGKMAMNER